MLNEKMQEAKRLMVQLEECVTSSEVTRLANSEKTLEELTRCMQEIFASTTQEQLMYKEDLIGLTASVEILINKFSAQRKESHQKMQSLMKTMNAQKQYGK